MPCNFKNIQRDNYFFIYKLLYLQPRCDFLQLFDRVAQLVEHLPFKEMVLGSSPSSVTNNLKVIVIRNSHLFLFGRYMKGARSLSRSLGRSQLDHLKSIS